MKLGIIGGAGGVGSSIGFYLATKGLVDEIALVDLKQNVATAHAMDMEQAVCRLSPTAVTAGGWEALEGCGIVVMAAGAIQHNALDANLAIVQAVAPQLIRYCPGATVVTVSNPVDILNYALREFTGMPAKQFLGFSLNDSARLRTAIAKLLQVPVKDVQAIVIGEHGQAMVPLFSQVTVGGRQLELSPGQKADILHYLTNWFAMYNGLNANRTAAWTTAVGVGELVQLLLRGSEEITACSAVLDGPYGISRVSVGVPVVVGSSGIARIVELPLSGEERAGLNVAAQKMARMLHSLPALSKAAGK